MDKNISTYYNGKYNKYVGARYVPIFADPTEWNNTKTYEPLTIVTHEGNSYTSRTFVPIGIDISNTEYWVITGNYNAQVEAYRQEVVEVKNGLENATNDIDSLDTKVYVVSTKLEELETKHDEDISNLNNKITSDIEEIEAEIANTKYLVQTPRIKKNWLTDKSVRAYIPTMYLNGFRFLGCYRKPSNVKYTATQPYLDFHIVNDLMYTSSATASWVCNFLYKGNDNNIKKAVVPFFEITAINGKVITLKGISLGGKFDSNLGTPSFSSVNNCDLLQIHKSKRFDGTILTAVSGSSNTVTVNDASTLNVGDFIVIAPPSTDYVYIHSYVVDQYNNVFNFGDDGRYNLWYGVGHSLNMAAGEMTIDVSKYISPLCTAVGVKFTVSFSTATLGSAYLDIGSDQEHTPYRFSMDKTEASTKSLFTDLVEVPMMHGTTIGTNLILSTLPNPSSTTMYCYGYLEP